MTFAEQIKDFSASDILTAFHGMPRSTAYDWLKGYRFPVHYLQAATLAHLRKTAKRKPNKAAHPIPTSV